MAESEWIVKARLEVPRDKLEQIIRGGRRDNVGLRLHTAEIIKRPLSDADVEIAFCVYGTRGESYMVSPEDVLALDGRDVLVFVESQGGLLRRKGAISPFEPRRADRLKKEVLNQRAIVENFAKLPAARPDEFHRTVKSLINDMLIKETQQEAIFSLQKLDARAAPSIIRLMDDQRSVPRKHAVFINPPGFFETYSHYSPGVVTDVLATVLPRLVHKSSFGQIYNGGTEDERRQVVDAWRVYLHYQTRDKAKVQPPSPAIPKQSPGDKRP